MAGVTFDKQARNAGLYLPLTTRAEQPGVIYDAKGDQVIVVDVDNERLDREAANIARLVAVAINRSGGFGRARVEEAGR